MNKAILVIVSLAILGIGLYYFYMDKKMEDSRLSQFSTWKKFTPASRLFTVILPSKPQYAKDSMAIPNSQATRRYDMYASEKVDGTLFLISMITYPPEVDMSFPEKILRQNIDEILHKQFENRLTYVEESDFKGRPAIDFGTENEQFNVEGKAILDDRIVYLLTYTTRREHFDLPEYEHFIDSFQILDPKKTK